MLGARHRDKCWGNKYEQKHMYYLFSRTDGFQCNVRKLSPVGLPQF